ncbi:DUF3592 domain-containing protein [Scleromatobacter humisilvae]|uniref:DUF3592 domain-containing protein n=1 Tax=Scleromatobacter humisilvae TaxID=2897159 RepID=A0A9X1YDL4_9BURK|nr:DUF3592 domain-containing protein [Scleromatobacter humisilvae]MCK9684579.1 DUF3592 domain-containing protein [Scleromatobacter humisilvae]
MNFAAHLASSAARVASLVVGASLLLTGCYNDAHEYRRLVESNATVAGSVADVDCGSHGLVIYSFVANGVEHRAKAPASLIRCDSARKGDPVTVFYDPAHPEVNTLLTPQQAYEQRRGWYMPDVAVVAGMPLFIVAFSLFAYARRQRPARAGEAQGNVK